MLKVDVLSDGMIGCLSFPKSFFDSECLLRFLSEKKHLFNIDLDYDAGDFLQIRVKKKDGSLLNENDLREMISDLIDHKLRLNLEHEFGEIRNKIVEQAFFPTRK